MKKPLCAVVRVGLLAWAAAAGALVPGPVRSRGLADVDATRLRIARVRVLKAWDPSAFPWAVHFQDPRSVVKVPSPDGRSAAWRGRDVQAYWLYVGRGRGRRLAACRNAYQPVWSPDSSRILYCAMDWKRGLRGLYVVPARTGARPSLEFSAAGRLGALASWSPDGSKIVFEYYGRLWVMNSNGVGRSLLNLSGRIRRPVGDAERIGWSSDGRRLAWQPRGGSRVYVLDLAAEP